MIRYTHTRMPPVAGLTPLSPDEACGIRARFVLADSERLTWGRAFAAVRRARGVVGAVLYADRVITAARAGITTHHKIAARGR